MEANLFLLLAAGVLVAAGVYLLLDRTMTKMMLGLLLLGNGANLFLLQSGGSAGSPPIDGRESEPYGAEIADPLAQAMILTAIVISMALTAFILTLAYRQYRYRTEDTAIAAKAARPGNAAASPDHDESNDPTTGRATKQGDNFGPESFEQPVKGAHDE